jgi:hypothetical protein
MAQWRRRGEQPPTQLIEFNPHDWRSFGYVGRYCEDTPQARWRQARMDWAMAHRDPWRSAATSSIYFRRVRRLTFAELPRSQARLPCIPEKMALSIAQGDPAPDWRGHLGTL